ncbi:hypothetical protein [Glutamicibacter sp.]|uniref:hypothetical protein n=1 Tax=Glutamicibacter sp. TaxID=1931995 RepID=UPI002FC8C687
MGKAHSIAVLAGAGVSTDAMPEGLRSLNESADDFLVQAGSNAKHRQTMPDNRIERLGVHDSLFSCAVGSLLQFRQPGDVDFFVVRENIFEGIERRHPENGSVLYQYRPRPRIRIGARANR